MDGAIPELDFLRKGFAREGYICDDSITVPVYLSLALKKPLLVEGAPGVGKTEIAKVLRSVLQAELIRLQCYEGLDETHALYEWNYQKQLLRIQIIGAGKEFSPCDVERDIFSDEFLLERPLLKAIRNPAKTVLLVDEVDRTDEEFEAFLFEVLSDFQVSIPEVGTLKARNIPVVVLTSNRSRELSEALKRRCVFLFIDYPSYEKELKILTTKVPRIPERLAEQVAKAVQKIRAIPDLKKKPSIAETIDWANALTTLGAGKLDAEAYSKSLNALVKNIDDLDLLGQPATMAQVLG